MEEQENLVKDNQGTPTDNSNVNTETPESDKSHADDWKDYKKLYSESSNWAIKIAQTHNAYRQVLKDNSYLLELDQDVAKDVVKQLHEDWYANTDSYEELVKALSEDAPDESDNANPVNEKEIAKRVRESILAEQQEEKANDILEESLSKYDEDKKKEYLKEFKEVLGDRKLTPEFAKKEIEKIIFYYNKEQFKQERSDDALSNMASNWIGKWKWVQTTSMTTAKLSDMGMPLADQKKLYPDLFPKT